MFFYNFFQSELSSKSEPSPLLDSLTFLKTKKLKNEKTQKRENSNEKTQTRKPKKRKLNIQKFNIAASPQQFKIQNSKFKIQ